MCYIAHQWFIWTTRKLSFRIYFILHQEGLRKSQSLFSLSSRGWNKLPGSCSDLDLNKYHVLSYFSILVKEKSMSVRTIYALYESLTLVKNLKLISISVFPSRRCAFNRPGVAGAVLQTPLSLFHWLIQSVILLFRILKTPSHQNHKS